VVRLSWSLPLVAGLWWKCLRGNQAQLAQILNCLFIYLWLQLCPLGLYIYSLCSAKLSPFLKPKQPEEATWHFCRCLSLLPPSATLKVLRVGFCSGLSPKCFKAAEVGCCRGELSVVGRGDWRN